MQENKEINNQVSNTDNSQPQEQSPIKNKPKLIISSYEIKPKMVEAGKNFTLNLSLYNTNAENTIYNLKVNIDQGNSQNTGTPSGGENNTITDAAVFSPVGRSNTFYRSAIYPWNYTSESLTMNVLPNAKAGNYLMNVNFEYEDYLGNQYQSTETIGIPVVQTASISTSDISMDDVFQGEPSNISLNIYNTGKDNLTNLMCKVEGDGFSVDEKSHFIGNFAQGASDTYSFNVTANEGKILKGKVVISYEDSTGQTHTEEKEFSKEISENTPLDSQGNPIDKNGEQIPVSEEIPIYKSPIAWGTFLVLIFLIVFFIRRKRKKKREKELNIDED
ncbi:hypothetical protein HV819_04355 [Anaerococcus sp. AGMB00486]|uniref:CARDB domain-containing protein n=1 Tax=Anaerococcus faecalis TaxID=2742993 RepID=A0ABX2N950_9FIRM|nr:CARDB domain-containing protein [Anaerococcus faecalis]NVF11225.1 hypothetical protein [Anaerococcus faecalis]